MLENLNEDQISTVKEEFCELILKALESSIKYGREKVCVSLYALSPSFVHNRRHVNFSKLIYPIVYDLLDDLSLPYKKEHSYNQKENEHPSCIIFSMEDLKKFSNVKNLAALK